MNEPGPKRSPVNAAAAGAVGVTLAAVSISLINSAVPGGTFAFFMAALMLWFMAGVIWLALVAVTRKPLPVLVVPLVLLIGTLAVAQSKVPLRVGFEISKGDLIRRAATGRAGRAGIYRIDEPVASTGTGTTRLPVRGSGFVFGEHGFLYAPAGVPSGYLQNDVEHVEYGRLHGPWYWYEIDD